MTVFYFVFFLLLFSCIFISGNRSLCFSLTLLMCFILAFRGIDVGSDTYFYYTNTFDSSLDFSIDNKFEITFQYISYMISFLGLNPRWCLYSLAVITFFFLYLSILRYNKLLHTKYIWIIFFYFLFEYYSLSFNISRQIAAASVLLYSYSFLFENGLKKYWFIILVLFASSIHISSIIFLPLYFVVKIDFSKINTRVISVFLTLLLSVVLLLRGYLLNVIMTKFSALELYGAYIDDAEVVNKSFIGFIIEYIELFLSLFIYGKLKNLKVNGTLSNLYLISLVVSIILLAFYGNIYRIRLGLTIINIIAYSTVFTYYRRLTLKEKIVLCFIVMFYGYFTLATLTNGAYEVVPYYIVF